MRWIFLSLLVASTALAQGRFGFHGGAAFGPSWSQVGAGATYSGGLGQAYGPATPSWVNNGGGIQPLVPVTNHTGYWPGARVVAPVVPVYYYWPQVQQPAPQPPPQQVIIEREVVVEKAAPAPAPAPQVIVIEQPAPPPAPVAAPLPPPPPPEPPKPLPPREPGPDVYSWVDEDGVVNYSTRAPANGRAKKLPTLAK